MKRAISTLSLAAFFASIVSLAAAAPSQSAVAAGAHPAATASSSKDVCGATKSKWAHIQCEQFNSSAPGDEYFGRMKLSYLGIDNTYKDGAISAGDYTTDSNLIKKLDFATDALRRWAEKYPNDPQLARSYFLGIQVLRKVYTQAEQQTTWEFMQILLSKYSNTYFGKTIKASLAKGFTEHWFALAQVCPTPIPFGVVAQAPSPTQPPPPAPGHPAVEVITPPCVQPSPATEAEVPVVSAPSRAQLQPYPSASPSATPTKH